jgi:ribosome-associated protein
MVRLTENELLVGRSLRIPLAEIELRTSRSSGPGGQHANKTESRVEAVWSVENSNALGPGQRSRLLAKLGDDVRAIAQEERSQLRNREAALTRLGLRVEQAMRIERRRVATKPSAAAKRNRLDSKRLRGEIKSARRKPSLDD